MNVQERTHVSASDLYVMIVRELRRRQAQRCASCFLELPFPVEGRGARAANWAIPFPPDCGDDCRAIIEDIFAEFSVRYSLRNGS